MKIKIGKAIKWLGDRAKERSTYAGLAVIALIAGKPDLADTIGQVGQAVGLIVGTTLVVHRSEPETPIVG